MGIFDKSRDQILPIAITEQEIEKYKKTRENKNLLDAEAMCKILTEIDPTIIPRHKSKPSRLFEYFPRISRPININFNDTKCEDFVFDFTDLDFKSLRIEKTSFIKTQFKEIKADTIKFSNCKIDEIKLGNNFKCKEFILEDCIIDSLIFNKPKFDKEIKFTKCEFQNDVDFDRVIFDKQVSFIETKFKSIKLKGATFNNEIEFRNCEFQDKVDFRKKFENSIYFDYTTFNNYADFSKCVFKEMASFCGATFKKPPNFFQAKVNGSLNLVNTKLEFDYEQTKSIIEEQHNNDDNETKKQKTLDETANEFRDSFRLFKNALIKDNNNLDASNFHKLELYCKEIELDFKKTKIFSRDWIDSFALAFYRCTSDHHSDLLKSFHSLLLVIGIFGLLSGIVIAWLGLVMFCGNISGFYDLIGFFGLMEFYDAQKTIYLITYWNLNSFLS